MNEDRALTICDSSLPCQENGNSLGRKRVTVYDIAKNVGVSHTTVARALRDSKDVPQWRRQEIQRVAAEMGYFPDPHLAALASYRKTLGPSRFQGVVAWINHWQQPDRLRKFGEFERYWQGAVEVASRQGFKVDDFRWPLDCSPKRLESMLVARGVEAVLIPPHNDLLDWSGFDWSKFSVLRFGMSVQSPDSNLVTADQFRATVMAITRMHEYGYRRIGLAVDFELDDHLGGNYHGGFLWAQNKLKLSCPVPPFNSNAALHRRAPEEEAQNLRRWLVQYRPDALLTTQPYVPQLLGELGYRIPEDIAVAGTSLCDIPVDAGIDQRSVEIGRIAMQMLIKQINVGERGTPANPCRILVESHWQDGQSLPTRN
ncbi:MAG TPA: LacI family DNA-binding transcriptional regulator [Verrucomicrobiae bacterium]